MSTNKICIAIILILIILFSMLNKKTDIENFSTQPQCKSTSKDDNCKKCAYPKVQPCKPQPCKPIPCKPQKCQPDCNPQKERKCLQDCPDMKRYILKSKIPACPECPDMNAYILKSEVPACPPQPDLTKYVLKTTVPPCKCPPCPKVDCPKLPKIIKQDCPKIPKYLERLSQDLVNERKKANMNNGCKINGGSGSYSETELKKIVEFYEYYKNVSKKYSENINIKETREGQSKQNCKLVANNSFGSATGLSVDSITNPYNLISNNSANYGVNQNTNFKQSESYKMHQSISEKYKSILN